jgi:hypothetical protein
MYSFVPMVDTSDFHFGFYIIVVICIAIFLANALSKTSDILSGVITVVFCGLFSGIGYHSSYKPDHPLNQPVTATFVSFAAEGFSEQSGKTRADKHNTYVVYSVNGSPIILLAKPGVPYPHTTTLYKN